MKILVVGSGGREHALCRSVVASPLCDMLYCAPGNGGISKEAVCVPIAPSNINALIAFSQDKNIDFVIVGPEAPLAAGLVDQLETLGIAAFGPTAKAAQRLRDFRGTYVIGTVFLDRNTRVLPNPPLP